tara:strand:+ start:2339 stop:4069 length:1731 start_codon:yes stop_codon:yes gene_type:complete
LTNSEFEDLVFKHSLFNASQHSGNANLGSIINKIIAEKPELKSDIKNLMSEIKPIVEKINSMSLDEQLKLLQKDFPDMKSETINTEKFPLPSLPNFNSYKTIITRFSPNPNGYLHIGHVKAFRLDLRYAQKYSGKLFLRFDDTNPVAINAEYYNEILENLDWMGIKPDQITYASDCLEEIYRIAIQMFRDNHLYICECKSDTIKNNRLKKQICEHNLSGNDNKQISDFLTSGIDGVVRFKGDMKSDNTAMRDPIMLRLVDEEHTRTGKKYNIWPTYDFAAPITDCLEGISHALRSKEFELRDELYNEITQILYDQGKVKYRPSLVSFSRLSMKGSPTSKSNIKSLIDKGQIDNWHDIRLVTLSALRKRGFIPEGISNFVDSLGLSKSESSPDFELLASFNRKARDKLDRRYFFVSNPLKLKVNNIPVKSVTLNHHPTESLGNRTINISDELYVSAEDINSLNEGDEIRLMDLFNIKITNKSESIIAEYTSTDPIPSLKKIHWVSHDGISFNLLIPNNEKYRISSDNSFEFLPDSLTTIQGIAENQCKNLNEGDMLQFNRVGFCRVVSKNSAILSHK